MLNSDQLRGLISSHECLRGVMQVAIIVKGLISSS